MKTEKLEGKSLTWFCLQTALLLQAAVPLEEGLAVMAKEAAVPFEKEKLSAMAEKVRAGESFGQAVTEAGCFPGYMEKMVALGERVGSLDVTLEGLSQYYERESRMREQLRRATVYPIMLVFMLVLILFVFFVRIMPIFSGVYEQLGAAIPVAVQRAIRVGGILSGVMLAGTVLLAVAVFVVWLFGKRGKQPAFIERLKSGSGIGRNIAVSRFCATLSVTLRSGLSLEEGMEAAEGLVFHEKMAGQIGDAKRKILQGVGLYEAIKDTGILGGFDLQVLYVAGRAGREETVLEKLAEDYDSRAYDLLDTLVARMEPVIVTVLALAVGAVLLSVMLPLVGILSSIG